MLPGLSELQSLSGSVIAFSENYAN